MDNKVDELGLKPCPFCGANVERLKFYYEGDTCLDLEVECTNCNTEFHIQPSAFYISNKPLVSMDAFARWNNRPMEKQEDQKGEMNHGI